MENLSAFLIFRGNSRSLLAPTGKCWQLKGIVPPGPLGASVPGVPNVFPTLPFSCVSPVSASHPIIWGLESVCSRSPKKCGVSAPSTPPGVSGCLLCIEDAGVWAGWSEEAGRRVGAALPSSSVEGQDGAGSVVLCRASLRVGSPVFWAIGGRAGDVSAPGFLLERRDCRLGYRRAGDKNQ